MTNDSAKTLSKRSKSEPKVVVQLALAQLLFTAVFSIAIYYCFDQREALSALFGGLIATLASLYFASRLFTTKQDLAAQEILLRFYISVVLKVVLTLILMAFCIIVLKVSMLPFIVAFLLAAVVVNWLFLLKNTR